MPFDIASDDWKLLVVTLVSLANVVWTIWTSKKKIQPEIEKLESEVADLIAQGAKVSLEMVLQRLNEAKRSERDWRNHSALLQKMIIEMGGAPPLFVPSESEPRIKMQ